MATAANQLVISEGNTRFLKWILLLMKGGTMVLEHIFDTRIPPAYLPDHLKRPAIKKQLLRLHNENKITDAQKELLYPHSGQPNSAMFDITLLVCLLQNVCRLNQAAQAWSGIIPPDDCSVEADICRIRAFRNETFHSSRCSMTEQAFESKWRELEQILLRLGQGIHSLQAKISDLKRRYIDTNCERDLLEELNEWKEEAEKLRMELCMSSELRSIASMSRQHLQTAIDNREFYVETRAHNKAKEMLLKNNVLIISGHPGEGKTTMALQLASEVTNPENFLRIRDPSDWCHVDLESGLFDTVLVDDIYGDRVLKDDLVKQWDRFIPDIMQILRSGKKPIKVIVATRHYILEDAKEIIKKQQLFKEEHIIQLKSKDLSKEERFRILTVHLNRRGRDIQDMFINECLDSFEDSLNEMRLTNFEFGFPQCAEMFASNDSLFDRGPDFFTRPYEFFRGCIEDLFTNDNEKKFLALIMIWARQDKPLLEDELNLSATSHALTRIAKSFGYKFKPKLIKILRKSLQNHEGGFVVNRNGAYLFSHNAIGDMVGIVIGKRYPGETLDYASRDFLLTYLSTNNEQNNDFHFYIAERFYTKLSHTLLKMLLHPKRLYIDENVQRFRSGGNCPNMILPTWEIDSKLVTCDVFRNEKLVNALLGVLSNEPDGEQLERFLRTSVMTMSGHFLGMGLKLTMTDITLPLYFLMNNQHIVMMELINNHMITISQDEFELSMLIAVNNNQNHFVEFLLDKGVRPTEEAKYIAAMKGNFDTLKLLMRTDDLAIGKKCTVLNGNSALLAASKKGLNECVKCLIENGADLNYKNADGMGALDKAAIYQHIDVCAILIEAGADLNKRSGKYKRTPLHVAADMGHNDMVKWLLQHGASTAVKDYRGHYPIHCAAIRGFNDVVRSFLEHDIHLSKQRIISYSKPSAVKGMTILHIAVWKEDLELIDTLLAMNINPNYTDVYGRTALYCACYSGKIKTIDKLLAAADAGKPEKQGFTPLHAAIHQGHSEIASKLFPFVNVNVTDKYGRTPLHVACEKGHIVEITRLIRDYHADTDMRTKKGLTPKDILCQKGYGLQLELLDNRIQVTILTSFINGGCIRFVDLG